MDGPPRNPTLEFMLTSNQTAGDSVVARAGDAGRVRAAGADTQFAPANRDAAFAPPAATGVSRPTWSTDAEASALLAARDGVRWGPIVAGLVTALTTFLLLSLLAVGIGITAADPAAGGTDSQTLGIGSALIAAAIGLVAFFLGGLVAGRTSAAVGRPAGALAGFLVWALGVIVVLLLAALGLSTILGAAGQIVGSTGVPNVDAPAVSATQAADAVRNSALGAFISLALPAIAATLGGYMGIARHVDDRTTA